MTWHTVSQRPDAAFEWVSGRPARRAVLLLGAFDPVTVAHVQLLRAASDRYGIPGAWCLTTVLLGRPSDVLVDPADRVGLLDEAARGEGFGLAVANRGTYVDVAAAAASAGTDAVFLIGSDKLAQLADPGFYDDGDDGVARTFASVRFAVVRRGRATVTRDDVDVLDVEFDPPSVSALSASEVRRRVRGGLDVSHLVPHGVAARLRGYTGRTEPP